jgi:hypothetical protein
MDPGFHRGDDMKDGIASRLTVTSSASFMFDNMLFVRPNCASRGAMARLNIFFSDQLLAEINRQAKEERISRSALLIEAAVREIHRSQTVWAG